MRYEDIPFMHWGIVSRHNFSEGRVKFIPRKRWDPLSAAEIRLVDDKTGKVVSIGKWKGHFSYVSPVRAHRPGEARESVVKDAFREIIEGRDYAIPITLNEQLSDSPFSIE
ncbi:MAG: hypothetical protein LM590_13855, partial [Thermofilum sp.]|nr:hypothetical protein [Thermofilum sp.]